MVLFLFPLKSWPTAGGWSYTPTPWNCLCSGVDFIAFPLINIEERYKKIFDIRKVISQSEIPFDLKQLHQLAFKPLRVRPNQTYNLKSNYVSIKMIGFRHFFTDIQEGNNKFSSSATGRQ